MKGGGGLSVTTTGKRRWRSLAIGVLFLVILSMFVPLAFLLGLHNGFHSPNSKPNHNGFVPVHRMSVSNDQSTHIEGLIEKLAPNISKLAYGLEQLESDLKLVSIIVRFFGISSAASEGKMNVSYTSEGRDILRNFPDGTRNETYDWSAAHNSQQRKDSPAMAHAVQQPPPKIKNKIAGIVEDIEPVKGGLDEIEFCELKFGSYCLWRKEHREEMKDFMVKKLKDQLFVARAYYPSIAKLPSQDKLTLEMKLNIQEVERVLSESATDVDLPPGIEKKLQNMEAAIYKAKSFPVDCSNVDKKLRQILDMTKDEASFHMKQSAFLYQLAVQTMPKSLHCLSMRLTVEYFKSPSVDIELSQTEKYSDPSLHHYVIFSKNILASSVVINSTVINARESKNLVFHVLTNGQNYYAMRLWFFRNTFREATVQVLNIEQLNVNYHDEATPFPRFLPVEFRVSFLGVDNPIIHSKMQYISVFSHMHFLLPEIFQSLKKVVVLDDDVVVQKDLSALWDIYMGGKVNGAVQFCSVTLGQLKNYLGEHRFDNNSCAWMSGLNLVDLARWRELDLTKTYQRFVTEAGMGGGTPEAIALRASLLTFQDLIYALDGVWALSGLGHDYGLYIRAIKKSAVLHYNGNMKPWLDLGIHRYKKYWRKFLNREDQLLSECNVHP